MIDKHNNKILKIYLGEENLKSSMKSHVGYSMVYNREKTENSFNVSGWRHGHVASGRAMDSTTHKSGIYRVNAMANV